MNNLCICCSRFIQRETVPKPLSGHVSSATANLLILHTYAIMSRPRNLLSCVLKPSPKTEVQHILCTGQHGRQVESPMPALREALPAWCAIPVSENMITSVCAALDLKLLEVASLLLSSALTCHPSA